MHHSSNIYSLFQPSRLIPNSGVALLFGLFLFYSCCLDGHFCKTKLGPSLTTESPRATQSSNASIELGHFKGVENPSVSIKYANDSVPISFSLAWSEGFKRAVIESRPELGYHYYDPGVKGPTPIKCKSDALSKNGAASWQILFIGCRVWTFPTDYDDNDVEYIYSRYGEVRAQNLDRSKLTNEQSNRTTALPLGLDFHTLQYGKFKALRQYSSKKMSWQQQLNDILTIREQSTILKERIPRVLVTWSRNKSTSARHEKDGYAMRPTLYDQAQASPLFDSSLGSRVDLWKNMSEYAFVFSPIGNGLDCYRFWEALALGCIVIVQKNPTASEFARCYPIIEVDDIRSISIENISEWQKSFNSTPLEMLAITNWLQPGVGTSTGCSRSIIRAPH